MKKIILSISALIIIQLFSYSQEVDFRKLPYLIYPENPTQMTVLWQTEEYIVNPPYYEYDIECTISWGEDTNYGTGTETFYESNGEDYYQYLYTIESLTTGTKYYYKVIINNLTLQETAEISSSFISAPSVETDEVTFYAYGDTRGANYSASPFHDDVCFQVNEAIDNDETSQTFILHAGDWVSQDTEEDWDACYFNTNDLNSVMMLSEIAVMGTLGNHETYGYGGGAIYKKYWPYPYQDIQGEETYNYSFDYGPVHFICIQLINEDAIIDEDQENWIINDLTNTTKPWKVMIFHAPGYSNGGHVNCPAAQNVLQPICEQYGVQLVIAGHNHYYAHWLVNGVHHLTLGGGGVYTNNPNEGIGELIAGGFHHFAKISIIEDDMSINIIDLEGIDRDPFHIPLSYNICDDENTIWENGNYYADEIRICTGSILTIKTTVKFEENGKIIIESGGKLILDDGLLTSAFDDKHWQGIEVWGDSDQHQYEYSTGNRYQGMLEMKNGATIENAYNAVMLWKPGDWYSMGGIIQARDANFYNNKRSVAFMSYQNFHPVLGEDYPMGNISHFIDCYFEVNDDYLNESDFNAHITMWDVDGIYIRSSNFINSMYIGDHTGYGIYTANAGYSVRSSCNVTFSPCPEQDIVRTVFEGLYAGIGAVNTESTNTIYINEAAFNGNSYGVQLNTVDNATIIKSKFNVGTNYKDEGECEKTIGMGVELTNCNGYAVEENEFEGGYGAPGTEYTGVRVSYPEDEDVEYNEIYKNEFNMLLRANLAEGNNRDGEEIDEGLYYLCNINTNNYCDFNVTGEGIAQMQGDFSKAAGNEFSKNTTPLGSDFNNQAIWPVNYVYDNAVSVQKPENTIYVFTAGTNNSNTCPSNYGGGPGRQTDGKGLTDEEKQYFEQAFYDNLTTYSNVEALYGSLKDGGNTEAMQTDIEMSWPQDMWELRTELLGKSPHLSKEVLITASDKTDVLPDAVIFEILSANPDELKDEELLKYLEDKENPLPQYMVDILRALAGNTTYKTILQSQMAYYNGRKTEAVYTLLRNMLNDSITNMDEVRNWLDNLQSLAMDYQIVDSYLQEGNTTSALALIDMMPQLYNITGEDMDEYNRYKSLKQLQAQLKDEDRNMFLLTANEKSLLEDMVTSSKGRAGMQARNILEFVYGNDYCDCPSPLEEALKSSSISTMEVVNKAYEPIIEASPNPAKNWTTFTYKLPETTDDALLQVTDAKGHLVHSVQLTGVQGQTIWDTRKVDPGVYFYTLKCKGSATTEKIVIAK